MRNINELIGIINGISYDGIINKLEVARLSSWVKKNRNLSYEHKQAHLISLVEQVLEDGIITDEEREMLLENCSQYTAFETDSIAKVYELNGIIEGIICDNEINEKEVCRLQDWMRTNESFIRYHKPSKTICEKIDQILEDGIVTQEEQKSLLEMLKKRLNDAQIETKIGYLKNCVKERKNLGIDLIDLLDNADAIDIIHSRAESQLGSTLNSYSGTYVRDPEIVFVSLVLIGMLYYDGAFYESVRKTYKSLYQRYSEQKVEGLIRTLLNNYRTKDDATGTKTRIINVVLAGSIVPSYYLGSFFEFIYDIYKLNFDSNLPDDLYGEFQFVYDGLQNVMRSESDEVQVNVTKKTYKLIKSTKQLITNPKENVPDMGDMRNIGLVTVVHEIGHAVDNANVYSLSGCIDNKLLFNLDLELDEYIEKNSYSLWGEYFAESFPYRVLGAIDLVADNKEEQLKECIENFSKEKSRNAIVERVYRILYLYVHCIAGIHFQKITNFDYDKYTEDEIVSDYIPFLARTEIAMINLLKDYPNWNVDTCMDEMSQIIKDMIEFEKEH